MVDRKLTSESCTDWRYDYLTSGRPIGSTEPGIRPYEGTSNFAKSAALHPVADLPM